MLHGFSEGANLAIKQTLIATSWAKPFFKRLLMRIAAWFV
jgi:hypothetical protein